MPAARRGTGAIAGVALVLAALGAIVSSVGAQASQAAHEPARRSDADSARTLRAARRAQVSFEGTRRARLPLAQGRPSSACDVRIGRFCYWHDDGGPPPPPEPAPIGRARARLLDVLDSAAARLPGDEWIAGQRVRYLLEAGEHARAARAAQECGASTWWCAALTGLTAHAAAQHRAADSAFSVALDSMPGEMRCRWTDVSMLLEGATLERWKGARCGASSARDSIAERLWWLARPFFLLEANDRRSEHLARRTMSRVEAMATAGYDSRWGADTDELMMRYGWPTAWTRSISGSIGAPATSAIGHEPTPSFHFIPTERLLAGDVASADVGDWDLRLRAAPERYAPSYLRLLVPLRVQFGVFRRGADALVVAGIEAASDTLSPPDSLHVGLAVSSSPDDAPVVRQRTGALGGALAVLARARDAIASAEVLAPSRRAGGRARVGIGMPAASGRIAVSDLLLYRPGGGTPASLEAALPLVRGDTRVRLGEQVGVLWETYGLSPGGETLDVTLVVERARAGWMTRAAERLRLSARARPVRVRWAETPDRRSGGAFRALALDLSHLAPGDYLVRLEVTARDGATATTSRALELVRR